MRDPFDEMKRNETRKEEFLWVCRRMVSQRWQGHRIFQTWLTKVGRGLGVFWPRQRNEWAPVANGDTEKQQLTPMHSREITKLSEHEKKNANYQKCMDWLSSGAPEIVAFDAKRQMTERVASAVEWPISVT